MNSTQSMSPSVCPFTARISRKEIQEKRQQLQRIYTDKVFTVHAKKTEGCALGTIFRREHSKSFKLWIGKIGEPRGLLDKEQINEATYRTITQKKMNLHAIYEKLASDLYEEFGRGFFKVPKTYLSEQKIFDKFTPSNKPIALHFVLKNEDLMEKFETSFRIMSKFIEGYQDFKDGFCFDDQGNSIPFIDFIKILHRPPDHLLTPSGEKVPLSGLMEIIAVGRVLADTDMLGGKMDNAGFVWIKKGDRIIGAQAVKIDPGCAFNFTHDPEDSQPSPNWVINTHQQLDGKKVKSTKDLQVAQNNGALTLLWDALTAFQKETFLAVLFHCFRYLRTPDILDYLFYRDKKFCYRETAELPEKNAQRLQEEMKEWCRFQYDIYRDELNAFWQDLPEQVLKTNYLDLFPEMGPPLRKKNFPMHELFTELIITGPISLEDLFDNSQKVMLLGKPGIGKHTLCQKITYDWASGKLWNSTFHAVYWIALGHLDEISIGEDPYEFLSKAIARHAFGEPALAGLLCAQMKKPMKKMLLILEGYTESCLPKAKKLQTLLENTPFYVLWTSCQEEDPSLEVDQTIRVTGFSDVHTKAYGLIKELIGAQDFLSAERLAQKILKLLSIDPNPEYIPFYNQFIELYSHQNSPELRNMLELLAEAYLMQGSPALAARAYIDIAQILERQNEVPEAAQFYYKAAFLSILQEDSVGFEQILGQLLQIDPSLQHLGVAEKTQLLMAQKNLCQLREQKLPQVIQAQVVNNLAADIVGFVSRILIERDLFQNSNIPLESVLYMANSLIKMLTPEAQEITLNLATEVSLKWKQWRGQPLSLKEQAYLRVPLASKKINILNEVLTGLKYSSMVLIGQSWHSSLTAAIGNRLWVHIPAICVSSGTALFGHYGVAWAVSQVLARSPLSQEYKEMVHPWLDMVGRLALGALPRAHATQEGIHYQYPSREGFSRTVSKDQTITLQGETLSLEKLGSLQTPEGIFDGVYMADFKLRHIYELTEESVRILVDQEGRQVQIEFKKIQGLYGPEIIVRSDNKQLEKHWEEYFQSDRETVLAIVQQNKLAFQHTKAAKKFRGDKEFVLAAVQQGGLSLANIAEELRSDREIVLAAVRQNGWALGYAAEKSDREIIFAAIEKFRDDKEIVLAAVQQGGWSLANVAEELRSDREIVLAAVRKSGWALGYAAEELRNDRECILAAVQQDGQVLARAAKNPRSDREIVLAAVQQNGRALEYASEGLKSDRQIVLAAVQQNSLALWYAAEGLKSDREFIFDVVRQRGEALYYVSETFKGNKRIVLAAIRQHEKAFDYASEELKNDREFVLAAVQQNGNALEYTAKKIRSDEEIVLAAVQQNGLALCHASEGLMNSREIVLAAVQQSGWALLAAKQRFRSDREIVLSAVWKDGRVLQFAAEELKRDREIVLAAVRQNGNVLEYAAEELKKDREILRVAGQ